MHWMFSVMRSYLTGKAIVPGLLLLTLLFFLLPLRWLAAAFMAALLHELGHYCVVCLCGGRVHSFNIRASGAQIQASGLTPNREILCLLAGPLFGLLPLLLYKYLPFVAICGLIQSAYNLLPIYPLDGGKILKIIIRMNGGTNKNYQFIEYAIWGILIIAYTYIRLQFGLSLLFLLVHLFSEKLLAKQSRIGYNNTDLEYNEVDKS